MNIRLLPILLIIFVETSKNKNYDLVTKIMGNFIQLNRKPMKTTSLFLILFFCTLTLFSQPYRCIMNTGTQYFSDDSVIHAIKIDSTIVRGSDTILYNYPTVRRSLYSDCILYRNNSWIGSRIIIRSNGTTVFITGYNDSLVVKTNASLGESWYFNKKIKAIVTKVDTLSFAGVVDSVKYISLQIADTSCNDQDSWINKKELLLSKNYGLVQLFEFFTFPDSTAKVLKLIGAQNPNFGETHISAKDIYNYEVGDEFHIGYNSYNYSYEPQNKDVQTILKVVEKTISDNGDTIMYSYEQCKLTTNYVYSNYDSVLHWYKTISPRYELLQNYRNDTIILSEDTLVQVLPDQIIDIDYTVNFVVASKNSQNVFKKSIVGTFGKLDGDSCLREMAIDKKKSTIDKLYLGRTYYYTFIEGAGVFSCAQFMLGGECSNLVYLKKAEVEYGIPFSCDTFIKLGFIKNDYSCKFKAYPNPFIDKVTIELNNSSGNLKHIVLVDIFGRTVLSDKFTGDIFNLSRGSIAPGIYILIITENSKILVNEKLLVK